MFFFTEKFESLDPSKEWIDDIGELLCSLNICFRAVGQNDAQDPVYVIPCVKASHDGSLVQHLWTSKQNRRFSEGRRLRVVENTLMFHPAFLAQLICKLLVLLPDAKPPIIWQGGLVYVTKSGCLVALYMHGAFMAHKWAARLTQRNHGEPERLRILDVLVKGSDPQQVGETLLAVLRAAETLAQELWRLLRWQTSVLLPASVQSFFTTLHKRSVVELSIAPPVSSNLLFSEVVSTIVRSGRWHEPQTTFTTLHLACHEGNLDHLGSIISRANQGGKQVNVNEESANGMTALIMACLNGQTEIVKFLIAQRVEFAMGKTWRGLNPLQLASSEGWGDLEKVLAEFVSNPIETRSKYRIEFHLPGSLFSSCFFYFILFYFILFHFIIYLLFIYCYLFFLPCSFDQLCSFN